MKATHSLHSLGQSLRLDNITRHLLDTGTPKRCPMPEGALTALADDGEPGAVMSADGGGGEEVLTQFAKAGVDVDALATQLQDEGAKSFDDSWNELMGVIDLKSAALKKSVSA